MNFDRNDAVLRIYSKLRDASPETILYFDKNDLKQLCVDAIEVLQRDPVLLHIDAPFVVFGDIHGQFHDLLSFVNKVGAPPERRFLFLGDYVDRGSQSVEVISYVLSLKVLFPDKVFLLRGNHESKDISRFYGFLKECEDLYSADLWEQFSRVFGYLPLAAVISNKIFCVHGGISPKLRSLRDIEQIKRPLDIPDSGLVTDLLWSDPNPNIRDWGQNERGTSISYGLNAVTNFLEANDFDLICRAHECVANGFDFPFGRERKLLTIFSAPNYCGDSENNGAILLIDSNLHCTFEQIKSLESTNQSIGRPYTPYSV